MTKLTMTQRKWLLTVHLLFSGILLGVSVAVLVLCLVAATSDDESVLKVCYSGIHILAGSSLRASTIGATVSGVLLSLLTHWGFFRYYWVVAKQLLTLLSIGIGIVGIYVWSVNAVAVVDIQHAGALADSRFLINRGYLLYGAIMQIISLAAMFVLSVFKPWGRRPAR